MFQKKTMTAKAYENGSNSYGNRFGGNGGFQDSLDTKKAGLEKWKPAEGENLVDLIPFNATAENPLVIAGKAEVGDPMYSLDYFVHRGIGPSKANITCLRQYGEDCPLCREVERLKALGGENEKKAMDMNAKRRVVYVVHDLKTGKYGYWDTGYKSVEEPLMNRARMTKDPETHAPANVFDWEKGMSLQFLGTKKKFGGKDYNEPSTFDFIPRAPLSDEVLEHSIDLATVIKKTSAEDMEKLISGKAYNVNSKAAETTQSAPSQSVESANIDNYEEKPSATSDLASQAMSAASGQSFNDMKPVETQSAPTQEEPKCPCGHPWGDADKHGDDCVKCSVWEQCFAKYN